MRISPRVSGWYINQCKIFNSTFSLFSFLTADKCPHISQTKFSLPQTHTLHSNLMLLMFILYYFPFNLIDRAAKNCLANKDFPGELGGRDEAKSEFSVVDRKGKLSHFPICFSRKLHGKMWLDKASTWAYWLTSPWSCSCHLIKKFQVILLSFYIFIDILFKKRTLLALR